MRPIAQGIELFRIAPALQKRITVSSLYTASKAS
jgi:hypothetical protein